MADCQMSGMWITQQRQKARIVKPVLNSLRPTEGLFCKSILLWKRDIVLHDCSGLWLARNVPDDWCV